MLVDCAGILFLQPVAAQTTEPLQPRQDSVNVQSSTADRSVILLSKEREKPFSASTIFRGILGMAVLVMAGFILSRDRKNIPWRTVAIGLSIQVCAELPGTGELRDPEFTGDGMVKGEMPIKSTLLIHFFSGLASR